ncbi:unnamed protein product [Penicillium nalgiovense]|nr:unnamed protein product [Penicillium nalgiovense]
MGRTVDQEVHAAFVEFRAKEDDKVLSLRSVHILPTNSSKEHFATETTSP